MNLNRLVVEMIIICIESMQPCPKKFLTLQERQKVQEYALPDWNTEL